MDECDLNSNSIRSTENVKYDKVYSDRSSVSNDESELNVADGEKENKDDSDKMQVDHKQAYVEDRNENENRTRNKNNVKSYANATRDNMPQEINKLRNIPIGLNELGEEVVIYDEELVKLGSKKWELTLCGQCVGHNMSMSMLNYHLRRMWSRYVFKKIIYNGNGRWLFKFNKEKSFDEEFPRLTKQKNHISKSNPGLDEMKNWTDEMRNYFKRAWEADREKERNEMLDDTEGIVEDVLEDESIAVKNITANVMNGKCNCDFVLLSLVVILFTKDVWHYFSFVLPAEIPPGTTVVPNSSDKGVGHSTSDPNFVETYFKNSRFHFIGTWKQWYRKRFPRSSDAFRPSSSISPSSTCQSNTIIHIHMDFFLCHL
uniref:BRCT domain-containing protein n=1 Tax=Tanacetum cinerariifolium TaxID=118510 RepID=A0A6L2KZU2_TANCI|nr:BRCT domain-containing protein [Tanacetum cinerariifolium]